MDRETKKLLDERLARMSPSQRRRLYSRALKIQRTASRATTPPRVRKRPHKWTGDWSEWDDEGKSPRTTVKAKKSGSLDEIVCKLLLEEEAIGGDEAQSGGEAEAATGIVISVFSGGCIVSAGDRDFECLFPPELAKRQQSELAVGDLVSYGTGRGEELVVNHVHPRKTVLSRPDPFHHSRERLIACNIDAVVIVGSIHAPPLQTRLIDRYLIAVQRGGAEPILCVNKVDLFESTRARAEALKKLEPYRAIDIRTFAVSATTGEGIAAFLDAIRGHRCAFVGKSGVGKSSLLNAIAPDLSLRTQEVGAQTRKGKHTTNRSDLYRLEGGTEIIDTPGVRNFGLWEITKGNLRWYFPEFETHARDCRFRDCLHLDEPDCAVRAGVGRSEIAPARYDTYRRIVGTLGG